ncbi:MAG: hypothetical protein FJY98_03610 [Candidatus Liptonbacteria bacterium]|nr:hypothetical protein [Candidatus Liptonbacteria bacterium]
MKKILIIYHGDCPDGFSGAWAAWKKFGNKAEYFGARRDEPLPDVRGREVYCIDFTPEPAAAVEKMVKEAAHVVLIDHHLSAKPKMELAPEFWFSLEHSGAVLAWEYFFPKKPVPTLLKYIEDVDLWKFKLPYSRELSAYMILHDFDFKTWDKLNKEYAGAKSRAHAVKGGTMVLRYKQRIVEDMIEKAQLVKFEGYKVLAVNSSALESEIGHALAKKKPPFGIVWREEKNSIKFSLRSEGKVDVSKIAEKYGGGGHKAASGFNLPLGSKLPWR